jgi:hypothetical protein
MDGQDDERGWARRGDRTLSSDSAVNVSWSDAEHRSETKRAWTYEDGFGG